ncbi:YjdF family protein [Bacillus sp. Bva_UNVM-123]|uniref:YjdF family protein n=1 Tax=Bacillus sp. Bva_UNVM-123 TaxID=2829798 RepID=UPI00391F11AA
MYYDGQFWIGIIEVEQDGKLKAFRYVFGAEPKDIEILNFIHNKLLKIINNAHQAGVASKEQPIKRINPKRLQRQVAKEMKKVGISTKAQEALKQEYEERKEEKKKFNKQYYDEMKEKKYLIKKQKAKAKHKGK